MLWSSWITLFVFTYAEIYNINTARLYGCGVVFLCSSSIYCTSSRVCSLLPPSRCVLWLYVGPLLRLPLPFTPPQVAIMSDMILMSQLWAPLHTDRRTMSVLGEENLLTPPPSAASTAAPSVIASQQVGRTKVSPRDITALCLSHGGSDFSTAD